MRRMTVDPSSTARPPAPAPEVAEKDGFSKTPSQAPKSGHLVSRQFPQAGSVLFCWGYAQTDVR